MEKERKALVEPYIYDAESIIRKWKEEEYEQNKEYPEYLRHETDRGEIVRSKSEMIIANTLLKYNSVLDYKYERPLQLIWKGKEITIYPDFTVLNLKTGNISYLEHIGLLEDKKYASDFAWKNNLYMTNNMIVGREVFYSFESTAYPMDSKIAKMTIQNIIKQTQDL